MSGAWQIKPWMRSLPRNLSQLTFSTLMPMNAWTRSALLGREYSVSVFIAREV